MAESLGAKHRKLNDLRRAVPVVSKSALAQVLGEVAEHGLPPVFNTKAMRQGAEADLAQWNAYGDLLQNVDAVGHTGETVPLTLVNFWTLLHASYKIGGFFSELLKKTMAKTGPPRPDKPYNLILYSDECYPGNPLAHRSEKRIWACYASFKEFTNEFLSCEDSWLLLFVARSGVVQSIAGQMGQVMKLVLLQIFHSSLGSPTDLGVALQGPTVADNCRLFFQFAIFIQDGAAQKQVYSIKGDSGSKFCLKCMNQTCILPPSDTNEDNAICKAVKKSDLLLSTNEQVVASWDRLASKMATETLAECKLWMKATGWSWTPHGILGCPRLRNFFHPISSYTHDWMHGMLSGGCMNVIAFLTMETLHKAGSTWKQMENYAKLWVLPAHYNSCRLQEIFARSESHRKVQKMKVSASDMLTLSPVFRHFVQTCGQHAGCPEACKAFDSMCHVLDLLLCTLYGQNWVTGSVLDEAVEKALHLCYQAGWQKKLIKKFHWSLHYGDSLQEHSTLVPCFSMERKHKRITSTAVLTQNLAAYEKSIYIEVLGQELHRLKHGKLPAPGLETFSKATKKVCMFVCEQLNLPPGQGVHMCSHILLQNGGRATRNDLVLVSSNSQRWDCGKLNLCFATAGNTFCVLEMFGLLEYKEETLSAKWQATGGMLVVPCQDVLAAVTYSQMKNCICTLIPYRYK